MKSIRQIALELQEAQRIGDEELTEQLEWELFQARTNAETIQTYQKYNEYKIS